MCLHQFHFLVWSIQLLAVVCLAVDVNPSDPGLPGFHQKPSIPSTQPTPALSLLPPYLSSLPPSPPQPPQPPPSPPQPPQPPTSPRQAVSSSSQQQTSSPPQPLSSPPPPTPLQPPSSSLPPTLPPAQPPSSRPPPTPPAQPPSSSPPPPTPTTQPPSSSPPPPTPPAQPPSSSRPPPTPTTQPPSSSPPPPTQPAQPPSSSPPPPTPPAQPPSSPPPPTPPPAQPPSSSPPPPTPTTQPPSSSPPPPTPPAQPPSSSPPPPTPPAQPPSSPPPPTPPPAQPLSSPPPPTPPPQPPSSSPPPPTRPPQPPSSPPPPTPPQPPPPLPPPQPSREEGPSRERPNIFTGLGDNSLVEKIKVVENRVCGRLCGEGFPSQYASALTWPKCHPCHCDVSCVKYHTCCPDVILDNKVTYRGLGSSCVRLTPTSSNVRFRIPVKVKASSMFNRCYVDNDGMFPENRTDADMTRAYQCERPDLSQPDQALPVSDARTNLTYRNVYCARCNGVDVSFLDVWNVNVTCQSNADRLLTPLPNKQRLFEMLSSQWEVDRTGCSMQYVPKGREYSRDCRLPERHIIRSCNETGSWPGWLYSVDVQRACTMYTSRFDNIYRNLFCFICNSHRSWSLHELETYVQAITGPVATASFSALFDFSSDIEEGEDINNRGLQLAHPGPNCTSTQSFDNATCSCRDVQCSEFWKLNTDTKTCHSTMHSSHIGYQGCVQVVADYNVSLPSSMSVRELPVYLERHVEVSHQVTITLSNWCPGNHTVVLHLQVSETQSLTAVKDESSWEKVFLDKGRQFCDILYSHLDMWPLDCAFALVDECPEYSQFTSPCVNSNLIPVEQIVLRTAQTGTSFLLYRRMDHCAFVHVPQADFNESNGMLIHRISGNSISNSLVELKQNDNVTRLCLEDYLRWTYTNTSLCEKDIVLRRRAEGPTDDWTIPGLISIIASCISLLFLILTVVTYQLFPQLRPKGYASLLVLTSTLFISQALYEFAIEQHEHKTLCSIFGICIHYSWLAAVFSMNACTIERFVKLCFPLESRSFFMSSKPFVLSTAHTFLAPLIVVGCNVLVNVIKEDRVGYGSSKLCYINGRSSRLFSFVIPVCVIVVVNVTLLVITVVKLRRQSLRGKGDRKKNSHTRIGLVACVRLSIVTGALWLLFLTHELFPFDAIEYVFTALLGLQGVVFFFSLHGNERVFVLYRNLCKSETVTWSGTPKAKLHSSRGKMENTGVQKATNSKVDRLAKYSNNSSSLDTDDTQVPGSKSSSEGGQGNDADT